MRPRPPVGFLDGVQAFAGAVGFIVGRPRHWPLALVPIAVFSVIAGGVTVGGVALARHGVPALLGVAADGVLAWAATVLVGMAAVLAGVLVGLALAQPLSGSALETLCRRQEGALGVAPWVQVPWLTATLRSGAGAVAGMTVGAALLVPLTLVGWMVPPAGVVTVPLKVAVTALLVAWDLLDTPMSLRGMTLGQRYQWIRGHGMAALGFGLSAAVFLVIPVVGLVALPAGAVGASRLLVKSAPR